MFIAQMKWKKDVSKRIVLHSDVDILHLATTQSNDIKNLQNTMTKNQWRNSISAKMKLQQ